MSIEILVNVTPRESRAALLENGALQELFIERTSRRGLVSNLYKGRVSRVLPGMQAAFLDIGLARTAFLHVADVLGPPPDPANDAQTGTRQAGRGYPLTGARGRRPAGAGGQGSAGHQGRAPVDACVAAVALPGLHAARRARRRVGAHRIRGRARPAARAGDHALGRTRDRQWRARRLHRAHRGAGRAAGSPARRHAVPAAHVGACARARGGHRCRQPGARGPAAVHARAARRTATGGATRAGGFGGGIRAHAGVHRRVHARVHGPHRAAPGAAPHLRPAWHRGRDQSRAGRSAWR